MSDTLTAVFSALADPTRRAILQRLSEGDASVAELAEPFAISQPAVSKHLKVLEGAGLISRSRQATARYSHLEAGPLREATDYMERYRRFWNSSFDRLAAALAAHQDDGSPTAAPGLPRQPGVAPPSTHSASTKDETHD